ncbi:hypothetical protein EI533_05210 [Pseudomonas donghuensis]|nr:hypothetical protein [Pseudomonas donghuensis]PJY96779.1 hypothetical protein COO64_08015 [Pseudomonas donghuensis]
MIWPTQAQAPSLATTELIMEFPTTLWHWYGQAEYKRVLAVCEAIEGLTFLAMSASAQEDAIHPCRACETWSVKMLPLHDALTVCGSAMPAQVRTPLQRVWEMCNELPETAFDCGVRLMFEHEEWQPLRDAAELTLALLEVDQLAAFLEELEVDCRNEIWGLNR